MEKTWILKIEVLNLLWTLQRLYKINLKLMLKKRMKFRATQRTLIRLIWLIYQNKI
jgi:hypothetical protein